MWVLAIVVVAVCFLPLVAIATAYSPQLKDDYYHFHDDFDIESIDKGKWKERYGEVKPKEDTKNNDSQNL